MTGGIAIQCLATTVPMFIGARCTSVYYLFIICFTLEYGVILHLVGFGLAFATNAAPLLITELAYPTQVSIWSFRLLE